VKALALALCLAATQAHADAALDNDLHIAISAVGAGASYGGVSILTPDRRVRFLFALAVPMAAGFGREYTQALQTRHWQPENTRDMGRNLLGALFGALFSLAVDHAIERAGACKMIEGWRVCVGVPDDD
jgi:hypothetical protein